MPDMFAKIDKIANQVPEERKISGANSTSCPGLDDRYGQIGISAVAAAARYQGNMKNPAYAPTPTNWRDRYAEEAV
jgi:hypothetical protein